MPQSFFFPIVFKHFYAQMCIVSCPKPESSDVKDKQTCSNTSYLRSLFWPIDQAFIIVFLNICVHEALNKALNSYLEQEGWSSPNQQKGHSTLGQSGTSRRPHSRGEPVPRRFIGNGIKEASKPAGDPDRKREHSVGSALHCCRDDNSTTGSSYLQSFPKNKTFPESRT